MGEEVMKFIVYRWREKGDPIMAETKNILKFAVCIALIVALAGCASTRTKESTGEYVDDSAITAKVKADLVADPVTKARQIGVETFKGVVQLSGFVDNVQEKEKASQIAGKVKGVRGVRNDIAVK
jgi:osmotically-inducible protein OsmY